MIKRIAIAGLGPHVNFSADLNPQGANTLAGPSESGKSFVLEAIALALWGQSTAGKFMPEAVNDKSKKAVVELTLDSGRVIRRTVTRTRSQTRSITLAGEKTQYANEPDFAAALQDLADDPDVLRLVVIPQTWQPLVSGNARKFRDLLGRVLPKGDVQAEVARLLSEGGFEPRDQELAWDEKRAMAHRRESRKTRDHAAGRRDSANERIEALAANEPPAPTASDRTVLDSIAAWEAWERAAGDQKVALAKAAQQSWDQRRTALGEEPEIAAEHAQAGAAQAAAQQAFNLTTQAYQEVSGRYQMATMQQQTFGALADPSTCPMCQRPGWEQGAAMAAMASQQAMAAQQEFAASQQAHQHAHLALQAANTALGAARTAETERTSWKRSLAALGTRPEIPEAADVPDPPTVARPDAEAVDAARAAEREALAASGVRDRWASDLEAAKAAVTAENERFDAASADAKRADALLEAIRKAPSAIAAKQALALGDLGPVSLEFGDNPAVRVSIDGRPWWLASRGRQVVADVWLRAAVRRAIEKPWLPIVIDNVQDVGGQSIPEIEGPMILMQTTDGTTLRIKKHRRGETTESGRSQS